MNSDDSVIVYGYKDGYYLVSYEDTLGYMNIINIVETQKLTEYRKARYKEEKKKVRNEKIMAARVSDSIANEKRIKRQKEVTLQREKEKKERKQMIYAKYGSVNGQRILEHKIWIGMTKEMAIESWGKPKKNNRTVNAYGTSEQWIYSNAYVYFDDGLLTSWQDEINQ